MASGAVAILVPHTLSQKRGMIDVGGGRGLWLFADLDTVVFDLVLLFTFVYSAAMIRRKRAGVTPLFVLLLLVFMVTAIPLTYTVSNFGTLFRLRQMLYVLVALLPSALAPRDGL